MGTIYSNTVTNKELKEELINNKENTGHNRYYKAHFGATRKSMTPIFSTYSILKKIDQNKTIPKSELIEGTYDCTSHFYKNLKKYQIGRIEKNKKRFYRAVDILFMLLDSENKPITAQEIANRLGGIKRRKVYALMRYMDRVLKIHIIGGSRGYYIAYGSLTRCKSCHEAYIKKVNNWRKSKGIEVIYDYGR